MPLTFDPGKAFQFDWSEDWAIIGHERTKLQVGHSRLSYSKAFIARAYLLQTHEMLFDAHKGSEQELPKNRTLRRTERESECDIGRIAFDVCG